MGLAWIASSCLLVTSFNALGQATAPSNLIAITGLVSDPSGARVTRASVEARSTDNVVIGSTTSDSTGQFQLSVHPGSYDLVITAAGFDPYVINVKAIASSLSVQVKLVLAAEQTIVNVDAGQPTLSEDSNGSALTLGDKQLSTLSDDDATFQQQLLAIAGGDGQHAPQIYVDGFSGGQFPPKSSIRSIKINQNPFSAEYDGLGFGRIEISTKPGTGRLHGQTEVTGDPSALNSKNPFLAGTEPVYYRVHTRGNLSGPIDGKTSFFVSADYYDQQNNAIINAQTVNSGASIVTLSEAVPDPEETSSYSTRLDRQWSTNNTFTGRFEFDRVAQTNAGLSQVVLPSEAYNSALNTYTLQLGNSQVLNAHAELDTRFEWVRTRTSQNPISAAPTILVEGTVNDGGSPSQTLHDNQDHLEFQENGTWEHKKHFLRFGGRYRLYRDANLSTAGYNGTFTFNTLAGYQAAVQGTPSASQFQITQGQASFSVLTGDLALWTEDEWKLRPNVNLDLGVRFESQSAIPDHADPSPHLGLSWAIHQTDKKAARVVLRTGAAIFYDRFPIAALTTAVRQNNPSVEQTFTIKNPTFFATTAAQLQAELTGAKLGSAGASTIYRVNPNLRSEYEFDTGATAEFSLGKYGSVSANYIYLHGVHQWVSRNANALLPDGTQPDGPNSGVVYEFASGGETQGDLFFTNPEINITRKIQYWGYLFLQHVNSDTGGLTSFASNSYNIHQDYGRSQYNRHYGFFTGLDADVKWGVHMGAFLAARGGQPFNITTGQDNNGDTLYNDRPSFASATSNPANVVATSFGTFDTAPQPGESIIPSNYGHSPSFISLQVEAQKTVRFGPRVAEPVDDPPPPPPPPGAKASPPPDPRYALIFSVEAQNVTNTVSPATPIGVLSSGFFGHSIATANSFLSTSAANRTFMLRTAFQF